MRQIRTMAAAAIAGLMMLASCAKDNENGNDNTLNEETSVKIQLTYGQTDTRAAGSAIANNTNLTFTEGHIFFTTSAGIIDKHVGVGVTVGSAQVSKADLEGGEAVINGISNAATKCYILFTDVNAKISSASGITSNLEGANISTVEGLTIPVGNINDASGAVTNVPLYGEGTVAANTGTTSGGKAYTAKVTVTINSLASRLQIGKISAKNYTYTDAQSTSHTVTIDQFTVEGIYVNNYYPTMTVGSTLGTIIHSGDDADKYSKTVGTTPYTSGRSGEKLADALGTAATGNPLSVTATGVWAYNVFPSATVPHVVIKLTGIKYSDNGSQVDLGTQYLTVQSFKYATGHANAGQVVPAFTANNIYTLSDIQFSYEDLSHIPYEESMDVLVEVQMMKWINNNIIWNN